MQDMRRQVVTGLVPPGAGEAVIREVWPSVASRPAVASLGRVLTRTVVGAPLAWLLMAPFYFYKVLPFLGRRYTLTNRRVMVRTVAKKKCLKEVALSEIEEVRIRRDANSDFFRSADLELMAKGQVALTLRGVPEPESFRHSVVNAYKAWVPGRADGPFVPAKAPA